MLRSVNVQLTFFLPNSGLIKLWYSDCMTSSSWLHKFGFLIALLVGAQAHAVTGDSIYAASKERLFQIRTLLKTSGNQTSLGSGFAVTADGFVVTNYHVVSQMALEPSTYRLEYLAPDGTRGVLQLLAIDVVNDLAVVKLDKPTLKFFEFSPRALLSSNKSRDEKNGLQKGERVYAMGNPLDLGFTIVECTYNSLVLKSYGEHIHFSGALNPGMSGGPAVDVDGKVVGVNVSKRLDGDLISFLVPARFADAIVQRARTNQALNADATREEINRQLIDYQNRFADDYQKAPTKTNRVGSWEITEPAADWITCWANTNAEQIPKPRYVANNNRCSSNSSLFLAGDMSTGRFGYEHTFYQNEKLQALQFPKLLFSGSRLGGASPKRMTEARCQQEFLTKDADVVQVAGYSKRLMICARTYRDFTELYDVSAVLVTQNGSIDALVSSLVMRGLQWDKAMALTRQFVKTVRYVEPAKTTSTIATPASGPSGASSKASN